MLKKISQIVFRKRFLTKKKKVFFWEKKIDFENALPSNPIDPSVL